MKETKQIQLDNPMLLSYQKYLMMNYSSPKTRYLYEKKAINFLNNIYNKTGEEPTELTQGMLDDFVIWLNSRRTSNPFYKAWIQSFRTCFDGDHIIFKLKTRTDKSRQRTPLEKYDWLDKPTIDILISKSSPYLSMMVQLYFETGRRLSELLNVDLDDTKTWKLDLESRTLIGIGKNNTEFRAHFSKTSAKKIHDWIIHLNKVNPKLITTPFLPFKKDGDKCSNPQSAFDYKLKSECQQLGIKDIHNKPVHTHAFRHSIGRYLSQEKKWKIENVAVKLSHKDINITKRYTSPDIEQIEATEDKEVFNS